MAGGGGGLCSVQFSSESRGREEVDGGRNGGR